VVDEHIGLSRQCKLAGVARATFYDKKRRLREKVDDAELILLALLDAEYTRHPFYGSRRMTVWLRLSGHSELPSIFRLPTGGFYAACFS
jgi:putative transposase